MVDALVKLFLRFVARSCVSRGAADDIITIVSVSGVILERIVQPDNGGFSAEFAKYVLSLSFPKDVKDRCLMLSDKAQEGTLSEAEARELDEFLSADSFLTVLKSKARMSLRRATTGGADDAGRT